MQLQPQLAVRVRARVHIKGQNVARRNILAAKCPTGISKRAARGSVLVRTRADAAEKPNGAYQGRRRDKPSLMCLHCTLALKAAMIRSVSRASRLEPREEHSAQP